MSKKAPQTKIAKNIAELREALKGWDKDIHSRLGLKIRALSREIAFEKARYGHVSDREFLRALESMVTYIALGEGRDWWECEPNEDDPSTTLNEGDLGDASKKIPFPPPLTGAAARRFGNGFSVYGDSLIVESWLRENKKRLKKA